MTASTATETGRLTRCTLIERYSNANCEITDPKLNSSNSKLQLALVGLWITRRVTKRAASVRDRCRAPCAISGRFAALMRDAKAAVNLHCQQGFSRLTDNGRAATRYAT